MKNFMICFKKTWRLDANSLRHRLLYINPLKFCEKISRERLWRS
jgi:hypothetical protein